MPLWLIVGGAALAGGAAYSWLSTGKLDFLSFGDVAKIGVVAVCGGLAYRLARG